MPPKLTLLLDAPSHVLRPRLAARGEPIAHYMTADVLTRLRQALHDRLRTAGRGPWLRIAADDPSAVLEEAQAAIEAMQ
jgi:hypothetical protein